ncbi:hypothetical protein CLIM01_06567 [Colletotrichum limetticola]|uniref:Uncharacterized protein n=1 Tax=Colletotrichum limetticola TaxID=1209924 RepID=A0ABQ9PX56_9PEZI|nr:hypothetical protein CLIM01_06567 [Colletotrichum limetticola]
MPLCLYHSVSIPRPSNIGQSAFCFRQSLEPVSCQRANYGPSQLPRHFSEPSPLPLPLTLTTPPSLLRLAHLPFITGTPDFLPHASVELSRQLQPYPRLLSICSAHSPPFRPFGWVLFAPRHSTHPGLVCAPT